MSVAPGDHGKLPPLRVVEGVAVIALQGRRCVEHFEAVNRQRIEHGLANSGPEKIVRMRRDGQPSQFVGGLTDFRRRRSLHVGQNDSEAKKVSFRRGHLYPRYHQEVVHRLPVFPDESFVEEIAARIARVVIGHRETVQAFPPRRGDEGLRTADSVP